MRKVAPLNFPLDPLTPRELDVLRQLPLGGTNAEIGKTLGIKVGTVVAHLNNIYGKLGILRSKSSACSSRIAAIRFAIRTGFVRIEDL